MDWSSIAVLVAERIDKPLVLLDGASRVRMFNSAAEELLGWRRHELEGMPFVEKLAPPEHHSSTLGWLGQAQHGALNRYECEAVTKSGARVLLLLEMALVGRGRTQGLLITVQSAFPVAGRLAHPTENFAVYEISTSVGGFGELTAIAYNGMDAGAPGEQQRRCYEVLYSRQTPCEDCPVLRSSTEAWPRTVIRRKGGENVYEVTTARISGQAAVRLSVQMVAESTLKAIREMRVSALAENAGLTARERAVLELLLDGYSLADIAGRLGISRRTAKFHQANLLEKLGTSSRGDLFRLVSI